MSREEPLDALLQRLNISGVGPSPARPGPVAAGLGSSTPRLDALSGSLATPPRPASASVLATPLSRAAGGRVLPRPSPSLLDNYLAESPRRSLGTSWLGTGNAPAGLLGQEKADPLASYLRARTGAASSLAEPSSTGGTPVSRGGSSPFAWDPLAVPPKQSSLPATPLGSGWDGEFSIPAVRSPFAPSLARADDGLSLSLRLSTLPGMAGPQAPSRLGAAGGSRVSPLQPAAERARPGSRAEPPPWQSSQNSADWSEPSNSSMLDGLEALVQQRELEMQHLRAQQAAAAAATSLARGAVAPSAEISILQSKVSELQAQLRLKDIEQQRTTSMAVEIQKERDALQERVQQCGAEVEGLQRRCRQAEAQRLEQQQAAAQLRGTLQSREAAHSASAAALSRAQGELEAERSGAEGLRQQVRQLEATVQQRTQEAQQLRTALQDASKASANDAVSLQQRVSELSAENQALQSQYSLGQVEKLAVQKQAEVAEARCRQAESRCRQLETELHSVEHECLAKDSRLEEAQQQVSAVQQRMRALTDQLGAATQQCQHAQRALQEERQCNQQQRVHASASQHSEAALAAQMKAMAGQIQHVQAESAALKAENGELQAALQVANAELQRQVVAVQSAMQDELAALENRAAGLQAERDELQVTVDRAMADFEGKVRQMEEQRGLVRQLRADIAGLQEALRQHEAQALQHGQQVAVLQSQIDLMAAEGAQLQQALRESKGRAAALEAIIAKSSMGSQATPLRDVLGSMRGELQEKDLQLVQCAEELAAERRHVQELQRQVLDQAVELDELQRQQSEAFSLRQQLAAARQSEAQFKKRAGELSQMLAALPPQQQQHQGGAGGGCGGGVGSGCQSGAASPAGSTSSRGTKGSGWRGPQGLARSPSRSPSRVGAGASRANAAGPSQGPHEPSSQQQGQGQGQGLGLPEAEAEELRQELARLRRERGQLAAECEARDAEVMQLQGQVRILQAQATDAENWLMAP